MKTMLNLSLESCTCLLIFVLWHIVLLALNEYYTTAYHYVTT